MNVLVLAPHTDDAEFGCGGTIRKLADAGHRVSILALSHCGLPDLHTECHAAGQVLGAQVTVMDFTHRRFTEQRQDILDALLRRKKNVPPDLVFLPNGDDRHQDHHVVFEEGLRAFKNCTLLGYELPWNSYRFDSSAYSELQPDHLDAKVAAMQLYESQQHRPYASADFLRSLATVRGTAIGVRYAECFQSIRHILNP